MYSWRLALCTAKYKYGTIPRVSEAYMAREKKLVDAGNSDYEYKMLLEYDRMVILCPVFDEHGYFWHYEAYGIPARILFLLNSDIDSVLPLDTYVSVVQGTDTLGGYVRCRYTGEEYLESLGVPRDKLSDCFSLYD